MSRRPLAAKRLGGDQPSGRLRALSAAILRGRDSWTSRGDAASYRLTARAAELAVVAELLSLPEIEQRSMVAWLLDEGAACLLDAFVGEEQ